MNAGNDRNSQKLFGVFVLLPPNVSVWSAVGVFRLTNGYSNWKVYEMLFTVARLTHTRMRNSYEPHSCDRDVIIKVDGLEAMCGALHRSD